MSRAGKLGIAALVLAGMVGAAGYWLKSRRPAAAAYVARPAGTLTFNKEIAPILFEHCAGCHRPGQSAPFALLSYADARKHARQIAEVTAKRFMPPWMPEPGHGEFADERRLSGDQIGMIGQWVAEGAKEGNPADLPPPPQWREGWQLGQPDLVVTMPEPYTLPAEGREVYRNFVARIPLTEPRYVRAVEFNPGNWKIVHHAFFRFDRTEECRRLDERDAAPGFDVIHTPPGAQSPAAGFLSWQPGRTSCKALPGLAWRVEQDSDLVLQLHMQPTGKPETVQASLAFYFTDEAPTKTPAKVGMTRYDLDVPAGERNYVVKETFVLPADVDLLAVLPHAHYLAREFEGYAILPDGRREELLRIRQWDFDWQSDYQYARPVFLPKGTAVHMQFTLDNSADNPANPHQPPRRVRYGLQSTDEMTEFWLLTAPRTAGDAAIMAATNQARVVNDTLAYNQYLLRVNANDAKAHTGVGKALMFLKRHDEAAQHLQTAVQLQPDYEEAHYYLGLVLRLNQRMTDAKRAFLTVVRLNPKHAKAFGNLGFIYAQEGNLDEATVYLNNAIALDPEDTLARRILDEVAARKAAAR